MDEIKLSGSHVRRTLAFFMMPEFRKEYLRSLHSDAQREYAGQLLSLYESGGLETIELVPNQDSICERCQPYRRSGCDYDVEQLVLQRRIFPFGKTRLSDLTNHFDPIDFLKTDQKDIADFQYHLMQHM